MKITVRQDPPPPPPKPVKTIIIELTEEEANDLRNAAGASADDRLLPLYKLLDESV